MKNKLVTFAGALLLIAVLGKFYARPVLAQARAALVQDVDQPARAPFQVTVPINVSNFNFTAVTIPAGKRLVVDMVSLSGAAQSTGGPIQPIIILSSSSAGNPNSLFYFAPTQSGTVSGQYYQTYQTTIFSDSLSVSPAFSGYTPSFMAFNVVISGHLITP